MFSKLETFITLWRIVSLGRNPQPSLTEFVVDTRDPTRSSSRH